MGKMKIVIIDGKVNVVSTTGVVHRADKFGKNEYQPVCNSNNGPYSADYIKPWKETSQAVTCRNCLRVRL